MANFIVDDVTHDTEDYMFKNFEEVFKNKTYREAVDLSIHFSTNKYFYIKRTYWFRLIGAITATEYIKNTGGNIAELFINVRPGGVNSSIWNQMSDEEKWQRFFSSTESTKPLSMATLMPKNLSYLFQNHNTIFNFCNSTKAPSTLILPNYQKIAHYYIHTNNQNELVGGYPDKNLLPVAKPSYGSDTVDKEYFGFITSDYTLKEVIFDGFIHPEYRYGYTNEHAGYIDIIYYDNQNQQQTISYPLAMQEEWVEYRRKRQTLPIVGQTQLNSLFWFKYTSKFQSSYQSASSSKNYRKWINQIELTESDEQYKIIVNNGENEPITIRKSVNGSWKDLTNNSFYQTLIHSNNQYNININFIYNNPNNEYIWSLSDDMWLTTTSFILPATTIQKEIINTMDTFYTEPTSVNNINLNFQPSFESLGVTGGKVIFTCQDTIPTLPGIHLDTANNFYFWGKNGFYLGDGKYPVAFEDSFTEIGLGTSMQIFNTNKYLTQREPGIVFDWSALFGTDLMGSAYTRLQIDLGQVNVTPTATDDQVAIVIFKKAEY